MFGRATITLGIGPHSSYTKFCVVLLPFPQRLLPLPSSIQHLSNDDCPGDKREGYQNHSALYCVLCTTVVVSDMHTCMSSS